MALFSQNVREMTAFHNVHRKIRAKNSANEDEHGLFWEIGP